MLRIESQDEKTNLRISRLSKFPTFKSVLLVIIIPVENIGPEADVQPDSVGIKM